MNFLSELEQTPGPVLPADAPVFKSLCDMMGANLVVNENGQVFITHDQQFPCVLNWAEYDADERRLTLISHDGRMIDFGMRVPPMIHKIIVKNQKLHTILADRNGEIMDFYIIPMTIRSLKAI